MINRDIIHVSSPYIEYRNVSDTDLLRATIMNKSVVTKAGCWEWQGARSYGYGMMMRGGKRLRVHRLSYELWCGDIPDGHVMRHKCDNPSCVNPNHLETGTQAQNIQDIAMRGRHGQKKLTKDEVAEIRSSTESNRALAERFGVGIIAIRRSRIGETWKHITNGPCSEGV
jgi:HNH endonuclease